jgi:hypothetical protein
MKYFDVDINHQDDLNLIKILIKEMSQRTITKQEGEIFDKENNKNKKI